MNNLSGFLDYFNERLEQEMKGNTRDIPVEKDKLHDLLVEIEFMLKIPPARATPLDVEGGPCFTPHSRDPS